MKIRRSALPALRVALLLAMADDCSGMKTGGMTALQVTGVNTTINVNAAATGAAEGAAQAGMDPTAGQKGATEYQGYSMECKPNGDGTCTWERSK